MFEKEGLESEATEQAQAEKKKEENAVSEAKDKQAANSIREEYRTSDKEQETGTEGC